jgi:hypothetical protein
MAHEVCVWHSDIPLMNSEADEVHRNLSTGSSAGILAHPSVTEFYRELLEFKPEGGTGSDEHQPICTWECPPRYTPEHVSLSIPDAWEFDYTLDVVALAAEFSLVVYDAQTQRVYLPHRLLVEKVYRFVAQQCGFARSELRPETRLWKDLGIGGVKAVAFFETFETEFGTDCSSLRHSYWPLYFSGPDYGTLVFAALLAVWMGFAITYAASWIPLWLRVVLLLIAAVPAARFFRSTTLTQPIQITLQDLVDAVEHGVWIMKID